MEASKNGLERILTGMEKLREAEGKGKRRHNDSGRTGKPEEGNGACRKV